MGNAYHLLYRIPALEHHQMLRDVEELAVRLVQSGRLRIDAGDRQNFVRLTLPQFNSSLVFSQRELTDPALLPLTEQMLGLVFAGDYRGNNTALRQRVGEQLGRLQNELRNLIPVDAKLEMRLARLLVQSAHPVVIALLLLERVEVYINYGYSIGDVMDVVTWKVAGDNNGMQSTDGRDTAVFVSCGGDPFRDTEPNRIYGDGFPSMARLMVIAGQELGHYSDIKRDAQGRQVSRYSANFSGTRATEHVRLARIRDMQVVGAMRQQFLQLGLEKLMNKERVLKFYKKQKGFVVGQFFRRLRHKMSFNSFVRRCHRHNLTCIDDFRWHPYPGQYLAMALSDMADNLAPEADAYKRDNPTETEAIACIEALARVPQQAIKWGHLTTRAMMPGLYKIYYGEVIPGCIKAYEAITGQKFLVRRRKNRRSFKEIILFWRDPTPHILKKVPVYE